MVCGNFILPEPASYVFFFALFNLRNLLYLILCFIMRLEQMQEQYTEDREMRRYLGAVLGLLLLLALAACGNKAAENVEETPGDPTGTVKVVTPQEEQTPEASDGAEQQPVSGDQKTLTQQETCLLYTSPSPRDATLSRMPSSA